MDYIDGKIGMQRKLKVIVIGIRHYCSVLFSVDDVLFLYIGIYVFY